MIKLEEYINNLSNAIQHNLVHCELYHGQEGCLRLAREFADGLSDCDTSIIKRLLGTTYGIIVVQGYSLRPPIDSKDWMSEIRKRLSDKYDIKI